MRRALIGDTSGYGGSYMTRGYGGPAPSALMESMALNDPARLALIPALKKMLGYTPEERARLDETLAAMNNLTMGQPGFRQALMNRFDALTDIHGPDLIGAGIINWHGGPNRWLPEPNFPKGRPRLDRIGSGEGAAAYGHGFYSAEARGVASDYRNTLSGRGAEVRAIDQAPEYVDMAASATKMRPPNATPKTLREQLDTYAADDFAGTPAIVKAIDEGKLEIIDPGTLKKLDIPDADVAKYLDWDAPLSQQPKSVQDALKKAAPSLDIEGKDGAMTGEIFFEKFGGLQDSMRERVTEQLTKAGIPGLKYYDQMSRGSSLDVFINGKRVTSGTPEKQAAEYFREANGNLDLALKQRNMDVLASQKGDVAAGQMAGGKKIETLLRDWATNPNVELRDVGTRNYVTWDQDVLNRTEILEP